MPRTGRKPAKPARRAPAGRSGGRRSLPPLARRMVILLVIVLLAAGAWVARAPLLTASARLLTVRDALHRADAIVLLGGDSEYRADEAARLYRRGLAPMVMLVRAQDDPSVRLGVRLNDTDLAILVLRRLGVPAGAIRQIRFPGGGTSTFDEARAIREWAYNAKPRSIILATNAYHTRRSRWLFRRQLEGLRVEVLAAPAPDERYDESNWWRSEAGLIHYFEEYLKYLHEWTRD